MRFLLVLCAIISCDWGYRLCAQFSVDAFSLFFSWRALVQFFYHMPSYIVHCKHLAPSRKVIYQIKSTRYTSIHATYFFFRSLPGCLRHNKLFNTHFLSLNTYYCCIDQHPNHWHISLVLCEISLLCCVVLCVLHFGYFVKWQPLVQQFYAPRSVRTHSSTPKENNMWLHNLWMCRFFSPLVSVVSLCSFCLWDCALWICRSYGPAMSEKLPYICYSAAAVAAVPRHDHKIRT